MKICYANDTRFHCGSNAITEQITGMLRGQGHEIAYVIQRPWGSDVQPVHYLPDVLKLAECDALVMNGEGTFREQAMDWEPGRLNGLRRTLWLAKELGLKVYLVNTVWYKMCADWGPLLRSLDGVAVREPASQREMYETTGVMPDMYPDAAYYAPIDENAEALNFRGKIVGGWVGPQNMDDQMGIGHPALRRFPYFALGIGSPDQTWSSVVKSLRSASLYITGQHHGVYAATKAGVPFVALNVNTHKITGLFDWADVEIPVVRQASEIEAAMSWAVTHLTQFAKLKAFLDTHEPWPGIPNGAGSGVDVPA